MGDLLTKVIGDTKEWKAMDARVNALPRDFRILYGEMKSYMWRFTAGDGMDIVAILNDVLGLLETSAAQGKNVLDVTGKDVAAFGDLRGTTWSVDRWRGQLNRDVAKKLAE